MNNNSPIAASAHYVPVKNINGARLHLNLSDCLFGTLGSNISADKMRLAGEKWAPSAAGRDNQICKYWTCDASSFHTHTPHAGDFIYGPWAAMALVRACCMCDL